MKKNFVVQAAYVLSINLLIKPIYLFAIDRNIQLLVGDRYGMYYTFFSMAFIVNILSDMGIQNFNLRFSSQHPQLIRKNFSKLLGLKLWLGALFFGAYFFFGVFQSYPFEEPLLFFLVGMVLWLNSLLLFFRSNIAARGWYFLDSTLSAMDKLLMIFICGSFLLVDEWRVLLTIERFVIFQLIAYAVPIFIALIALNRFDVRLRPMPQRLFSVAILKKSLPYALVVLLMSIYARIDTVMLAWLHPLREVAVDDYAKSFRILEALNMFGFLLSGLLLPMFSKLFKKGQMPSGLFYTAQGISVAIVVPVVVTGYLFSKELMQLLYYSTDTSVILEWHVLAFGVNTISYVFGTLITAQGSIHKLNLLFLAGCALNVGLNYYVIPERGPEGAAMTTFITQLFILGGQAIFAFRWLYLRFDWQSWLRFFTYALIVAVAIDPINYWMEVSWYFKGLLVFVFALISTFALKIISWVELIAFMRTKFSD